MSSLPRATCEIQGYVYDAKVRVAGLAWDFWRDPGLAARLEREAADLKRRFNEDFWLAERDCFALALDGEKRSVDALTSNIGHLLWSGIVDDEKAEPVARHLVSDALFSGWGARTMAIGEGAYNPLGYHTGTVWPHDTSLIAAGLARYGYRKEAGRLAFAMLEAAEFFQYRLPEAVAGYPRARTLFPVEYPTACSPQAWASGAPLLFVTTMLGLQLDAGEPQTDPALPDGIGRLELEGLGRHAVAAPASPIGAVARAAAPTLAPPRSARELFERFAEHVDPARTRGEHATYRFDVEGVGSWLLEIHDGRVTAREGTDGAGCVIRIKEDLLLGIARGEQNPAAAFLSGAMQVEGDVSLAMKLEKFRPFRW